MIVLLHFACNEQTGLGHYYRMEALCKTLTKSFHKVWVLSDRKPPWYGIHYLQTKPGNVAKWAYALDQAKPDWVVADLPGEAPGYLFDRKWGKLCLIDGVGHPVSEADLVVSQGPEGEYNAPDYLLLRSGLGRYRWQGSGGIDLVFGGASDRLGLLDAYMRACPDRKAILLNPLKRPVVRSTAHHWISAQGWQDPFALMAQARQGVFASGMILMEGAALGLPMVTFSLTERHLETALWMQEQGWLKAWEETGLLEPDAFREFVAGGFTPTGDPIDLGGPDRVMELLEERL